MHNTYSTRKVIISKIKRESVDTNLYSLRFVDGNDFQFLHGQFVMAGRTGWGEAPFDICGSFKGGIELAIRRIGKLTSLIHNLSKGDWLEVRGPYGNSFPQVSAGKNLLIIGGGCGFITFRAIIDELAKYKGNRQVRVFLGAASEDFLLFRDSYERWQQNGIELAITLDNPSSKWLGRKGVITKLFADADFSGEWMAFLCGPTIMYKFVVSELKNKGFSNENIFLSFERRMHCGVGVCHHCACGTKHICKDGPIFNYNEAKKEKML